MPDPSDLTAVEALLEEREALRGWIARLDDTGNAAPEAVRARVRSDYQARLDGVDRRLGEYADVVTEQLGADQREHAGLMEQARVVREALAEAELRYAVGEFADDRYEQERSRAVADLERLEGEIGAVAERITQLEDVHGVIMNAPQVPAAAAIPSEDPLDAVDLLEVVEVVEVDEVVEIAGLEVESSPVEEEPGGAGEPAMDDLLSIFDAAPTPTESMPRFEPIIGEHPPVRIADQGPLSFTPNASELPGTPRQGTPVPPIGMPGADQSPRFVRPGAERGSELVELAGKERQRERSERLTVVPDPEPVLPEALPDAPDAAARTLRCGECGAMNRPLEWYCEKCGAELTAI